MKILIAGATGAIGMPLIGQLRKEGHTVFAMLRSAAGAAALTDKGADAVIADALESEAVRQAVLAVRPDAIINELTSLPKHYTPDDMKAAAPRDREVRIKGHANLLAAAHAAGCGRYVLQSSGFWYAPGEGLADENASFAFQASPGIAAGSRTYAELEAELRAAEGIRGVMLRYGFFYGPGTWFVNGGDAGEQVRRREVPVIGKGQGVWNWVHIEDAARATAAALNADPGAYNIVDNQPSDQRAWLPAFARSIGAPEPPAVSEEEALRRAGADTVYYATKLRGASNEKAKRILAFRPRPLEWIQARGSNA